MRVNRQIAGFIGGEAVWGLPPGFPSLCLVLVIFSSMVGVACNDSGELVRLRKEISALEVTGGRLERELADRDRRIAQIEAQNRDLIRLGGDRPLDLFAPVKIEIRPRSGGFDSDGKPGDDGVKVYVRPLDADGHPAKVPGEFEIQILDNSILDAPRVIGRCIFNDPEENRRFWYGDFPLTDHYSLECPFLEGEGPPASRRVTVTVEFLDYLSGRRLRALQELVVTP